MQNRQIHRGNIWRDKMLRCENPSNILVSVHQNEEKNIKADIIWNTNKWAGESQSLGRERESEQSGTFGMGRKMLEFPEVKKERKILNYKIYRKKPTTTIPKKEIRVHSSLFERAVASNSFSILLRYSVVFYVYSFFVVCCCCRCCLTFLFMHFALFFGRFGFVYAVSFLFSDFVWKYKTKKSMHT